MVIAPNALDGNHKVSYASGRFFMSGIQASRFAGGHCSARLFSWKLDTHLTILYQDYKSYVLR